MNQKNLGPFLINPERAAPLEIDVDFPKGRYIPDAREVAEAIADAELMNRNMRLYGTIDAPRRTAELPAVSLQLSRQISDRGRAHAHLGSFDKDRERINFTNCRKCVTCKLRRSMGLDRATTWVAYGYPEHDRLNTRDEPFTWLHVVGLLVGVALIALGVAL